MKRESGEGPSAQPRAVRVDKWLWAARFYKSRALSVEAIAGGKIEVNGERVKPSRDLKVGESVQLRLGTYEHIVIVRALSDRRGPATQARTTLSPWCFRFFSLPFSSFESFPQR